MIRFENLSKSFWYKGFRKMVIDHLDETLPSGKSLALLGKNGAGKSTLLSIISGAIAPDTGRVISDGTISWPVGFGGSLHSTMTGAPEHTVRCPGLWGGYRAIGRLRAGFQRIGPEFLQSGQDLFQRHEGAIELWSVHGDQV